MGEGFDIRRYEPADAGRVLTVYELALEADGWEFPDDPAPDGAITDGFLGITDDYLDVGGEFLVGVRHGEVIATGGFQPRGEATAELRKMAVHPDHQRHGYGERILVELEARAESRGFARLVLETFDRLTSARHLYEKHGYEETNREHDETVGGIRVSYAKEL